jgi:hypothetical protein
LVGPSLPPTGEGYRCLRMARIVCRVKHLANNGFRE